MTNKKTFLIFLFFTVFGCNTDSDLNRKEVAQGPAIRFGGKITQIVETKAIIDDEQLPDGFQIGLFAWGHHKDEGEANTQIRSDLNNAAYIQVSGSNELTTNEVAHYPVNPDTLLNIYAYYPYLPEAADNPLQIPFDLSHQEDLMWATPILNQNKESENPVVMLTFNHLFSAITLKFKKADDIREEMILQSVAMENYNPAVQLDVQKGELSQPTTTTSFPLIRDLTTTVTQETQTVLTDFLLCPVAKPVFVVRLSDKEYRIESSKAFLAGKKQTYEFTIRANDITVSGSISPWGDGGSSNETIYF